MWFGRSVVRTYSNHRPVLLVQFLDAQVVRALYRDASSVEFGHLAEQRTGVLGQGVERGESVGTNREGER